MKEGMKKRKKRNESCCVKTCIWANGVSAQVRLSELNLRDWYIAKAIFYPHKQEKLSFYDNCNTVKLLIS